MTEIGKLAENRHIQIREGQHGEAADLMKTSH